MGRLNIKLAGATVAAAALLGACGGSSTNAVRGDTEADALFALDLGDNDGALQLASPNFVDGDVLPARFGCDSTSISPALTIDGVPDDAVELALVVDDPDARGGTYTHWIVAGISPQVTALAEDWVPDGTRAALNSAGRSVYSAPCPPEGEAAHTYRFSLYVLDEATPDDFDGEPASDALETLAERAVARATLTATFDRAG